MKPEDLQRIVDQQTQALAKISGSIRDLLTALEADRQRRKFEPWCSNAAFNEHQVSKRPIFVKGFTVYNASAANTWYVQIHNACCPPANNQTTRIPPLPVAPNTTEYFDGGDDGVFFENGVYVCGSSTDILKTLISSNDIFVFGLIRYV